MGKARKSPSSPHPEAESPWGTKRVSRDRKSADFLPESWVQILIHSHGGQVCLRDLAFA